MIIHAQQQGNDVSHTDTDTGRLIKAFDVDKREQSIQLPYRGMAVYKVVDRENRTVAEGKFIH